MATTEAKAAMVAVTDRDCLKEEPRFEELLKKVGLDQWPRPKPKLEPEKNFNKR